MPLLFLNTNGRIQYSAIFPGLGQYKGGRYAASTLFLSSEVLALVGAVAGYIMYNQAVNDYDDSVSAYKDALDPDMIERTRREMIDAHDNADKTLMLRQGAFISVGGIWALNIIHAVIAGPYKETNDSGIGMNSSDEDSWEMSSIGTFNTFGVSLKHRF